MFTCSKSRCVVLEQVVQKWLFFNINNISKKRGYNRTKISSILHKFLRGPQALSILRTRMDHDPALYVQ